MNTSKRRLTLVLPVAAALVALAGLARAEPAPEAADPKGVVGVCVRWGADDSRLADVVVVEPSGDATLDTAIPETLRSMEWKKPSGYTGEWVALSVGVAGAKPTGKLPSCSGLAAEEAVGPPKPLKIGKLVSA